MKKTMRFMSLAALALVGAVMTSCSNEDSILDGNPQQPATTDQTVTLTTTVSLDGSASTRALTDGGVKTFAAGDQIVVIYTDTDGHTQKAVSDALTSDDINGKNATFTVMLNKPVAGGTVRYIYPAAMAAATVATSTAVNADAGVRCALRCFHRRQLRPTRAFCTGQPDLFFQQS